MNADHVFRLRLLIVGGLMALGVALLGGKLWYEQIHFGERYRESISRQSVRRVRLPGLRGRVFTSDYLLLADNAPSYNLVFYLQEMRRNSRRRTVENIRNAAAAMSRALNRPDSLTEERILRHIKIAPGLPLEIYTGLSEIELARVFQMMPRLPGIGVEVEPVRRYPEGKLASGVIGYTRLSDALKEPDRNDFFYYAADQTGKNGVERAFENFAAGKAAQGLRGTPGYELIQVDHLGFVSARQLEKEPPVNGDNVILTLDSQAQKIGERLLRDLRGALVLVDADTGAVLALVSSPGYDLSQVSPVWAHEYYQSLLNDPARPLLTRAFQGVYTPGSIVKPLVALAALKDGFDPGEKIECDGHSVIGGARISCANHSGHGVIDLREALEKSCNDYMIEMGTRIGLDKIAAMFRLAGIGEPTGLELGGATGMLPAREQKERIYRQSWNKYDTALISIGQGLILLSPVQAARYTAALANGGRLPRLHILKEIASDTGEVLYRTKPELAEPWPLPPGALEVVRDGMFRVVNASEGSGRQAHSELLTLYGKTGTAEVDTREGRINNTWFIAFCEYRSKRYALAVLVEFGRSGGRSCAPLAREFFEEYLRETRDE